MKKIKINLLVVSLLLISALQVAFVSCSDDPGVDSYYTQTREYASSYLQNRGQFSKYLQILRRATGERGDLRLVDMLGTYGTYTVFAPTNDAIDEYLASKGVTSVDSLTKEDCDTIALNSIIERAYFTTDNCQDMQSNMLERKLTFKFLAAYDEELGDSVPVTYINSAIVTHENDSVANGVVHTVKNIVDSYNGMVDALFSSDSTCLLYSEAFQLTHIADSLQKSEDESYGWATDKDRIDSCTWTNDKLCIHTAVEYDNVAYPEKRYYNYTVFMCQDSILKEKYGIVKLLGKDDPTSLEYKAHELYDPMYPEDADVDDYTDRRNALNRFISYHVLNRYGSYYTLTCNDNERLPNNFNRRRYDICDYYETLMPHSLMKFSFPSGSQVGLYINRRGVQSRSDDFGVYVRGAKVLKQTDYPDVTFTATNGIYHYIDDIVAYDMNTQEVVLNECIRTDCSTLSPDFMTLLTDGQMARGHASNDGKNYQAGGQGSSAANNKTRAIGFKPGYIRNFKYGNETHLHVRGRVLNYWSYEGDELIIKGRFDLTVKLPPVPAGTYEVRMMTCTQFDSRGIIQYYIDGNPQGIPFDMRPGGVDLFGFKTDADLGDDDAIAAFDKSIHNIGWMRGPGCYATGDRSSYDASATTMRNLPNTIRKVVGQFYTDGKSDHYLRIQQKMESENNELNFDFIELCPSSVYNNEYYSEPKW